MWKFLKLIYNQFQPKVVMSGQLLGTESVLNRRQLYKNQKLLQINQIYYCECGKNYLTFSALYLHARNKHDVKLTTKRSPQNCRVEQREDKTIVTYFICPNQPEQPLQSPSKQDLQISQNENQRFAPMVQLVEGYLSQENSRLPSGRSYRYIIIEQLGNYFRQLEQMQEGGECPLEAENITLYFNDFISYYLPLAHQQKIISLYALGQAENELIRFWRWLRERKYTESQLLHRTYPAPAFTS